MRAFTRPFAAARRWALGAAAGFAGLACATRPAPPPASASAPRADCAAEAALAEGIDRLVREGGWDAAGRELDRRLAACPGPNADRARLLTAAARFALDRSAYHRRDVEGAREAVRSALDAARAAAGEDLLAPALLVEGRFLYGRGFEERSGWKPAGRALSEALAASRRAGDRRTEAEALFYLGLVEQQEGRVEPAARLFRECVPLAAGLPDPFLESFLERHLGALARAASRPDEAERRLRRSLDLREKVGATVFSPFAMIALADFLAGRSSGEAEQRALLERAAEVARSAGSPRAAATALLGLADRLASSDRAAALAAAERALEPARFYGDPELLTEALRARDRLAGVGR